MASDDFINPDPAKRSPKEDKVTKALDANSEGQNDLTQALNANKKEMIKVYSGTDRVAVLAEIHLKATESAVKGLVEDYKKRAKAEGFRADSNAIDLAKGMKDIV